MPETEVLTSEGPPQRRHGEVIKVGQATFIRDGEEVFQGNVKIHPAYLTDEERAAIFPERMPEEARPEAKFICPIEGCEHEISERDKRSFVSHYRAAHPEIYELLEDKFRETPSVLHAKLLVTAYLAVQKTQEV